MKDYSEYLNKPGMLEYIEKEWLDKPEMHDFHAGVVNELIDKLSLEGGDEFFKGVNLEELDIHARITIKVLEVGCGTGNIATRLEVTGDDLYYHGVDSNEQCINIAKLKAVKGRKVFTKMDIRLISEGFNKDFYNIVISFGFLKHFNLQEWSFIFEKVCSLGEYLVFDMPIAEKTKDDGLHYHHIWMNLDELKKHIKKNGFEILEIIQFGVEPVFVCKRK